jgi:hypothetical protein
MLSKIPIIGYLRHTRARDHGAACKEFALATFFGFLPVWVALLINFLLVGPRSFGVSWQYQIDSGAVFLIIAALLSSYVYVLWSDDPDAKKFPHKTAFSIIFLGFIVAWAVVLGIQAVSQATLLGVIKVNPDSLRLLTYSSLSISIPTLYLMFVYKSAVSIGYAKPAREDAEKFDHDWKNR